MRKCTTERARNSYEIKAAYSRLLWLVLACLLTGASGCTESRENVQACRAQAARVQSALQMQRWRIEIESVLRQDASAARISDSTERLARKQQIDTSGCPPEFRSVYLDHISAWQRVAKLRLARAQLAKNGRVETALMRSLLSGADVALDFPEQALLRPDERLRRWEEGALSEVGRTDDEVRHIAAIYHAGLPMRQ